MKKNKANDYIWPAQKCINHRIMYYIEFYLNLSEDVYWKFVKKKIEGN